jgi:hypothetical protein
MSAYPVGCYWDEFLQITDYRKTLGFDFEITLGAPLTMVVSFNFRNILIECVLRFRDCSKYN